jgi:DNA-binding response OmpR family regulator
MRTTTDEIARGMPSETRVTSEPLASPVTIMIIEDDAVSADTFARILTMAGYHVVTAQDADTGLAAIERAVPAALLLDLRLPRTDGLELLRRLRSSPVGANLPVAVVTGDYFLEEAVARDLERLGARLFFKPLWEEDLLKLAGNLVTHGHAVRRES